MVSSPIWIARAEDGTVFQGAPSWVQGNWWRWGQVKQLCEEEGKRLKSLSLFVPPYGWLHAPEGKGAYGFFEQYVSVASTGKSGCRALGICWPEDDGHGKRIVKVHLIRAGGILEHWNRHAWQPCMIGSAEWQPGKDDGRPFRDGTPAGGN